MQKKFCFPFFHFTNISKNVFCKTDNKKKRGIKSCLYFKVSTPTMSNKFLHAAKCDVYLLVLDFVNPSRGYRVENDRQEQIESAIYMSYFVLLTLFLLSYATKNLF